MNPKEELKNTIPEVEKIEEYKVRMIGYFKETEFWHQATLEFLNQPIDISTNSERKLIIDLTQESPEKRAEQIEYVLSNKKIMDGFFCKACSHVYEQDPSRRPNCVSYATFVATFSQWMNPQNETIFFLGDARVSSCPDENEIGTLSDHFWTEVNGKIFDNSDVLHGYSYTNLRPLWRSNDILSGNFRFEKVN